MTRAHEADYLRRCGIPLSLFNALEKPKEENPTPHLQMLLPPLRRGQPAPPTRASTAHTNQHRSHDTSQYRSHEASRHRSHKSTYKITYHRISIHTYIRLSSPSTKLNWLDTWPHLGVVNAPYHHHHHHELSLLQVHIPRHPSLQGPLQQDTYHRHAYLQARLHQSLLLHQQLRLHHIGVL
ncbi:hypothetical protein K440DRAFT_625273 [Wilcoxina mikolae CBS 423.85]|nr:hypothetical protein K440DRAFT_625273 [Wilcoxina mikolae CBS 423.85]